MNILGRMDCRVVSSSAEVDDLGSFRFCYTILQCKLHPRLLHDAIVQSGSQWDAADKRRGG